MKRKIYSIVIAFLLVITSYAAIIPVTVADFVFTPNNFTAQIGDVVRFTWVNGIHTTTSTSIPSGAGAWDQPMTSGNTIYNYTITQSGAYNYQCTPHAAFGMTGSFTVTAITPVKLIDFSAGISGNTIVLKWRTATEENADHFAVQRSYDGIGFENIGKVVAAGNSNSELKYSFSDETFSKYNRFHYYRLLTIDKDLKQQHSKIILHRLEKVLGKNSFITRIFPNPGKSNGHLYIKFDSDKQESMVVAIHDVTGKIIYTRELFAAEGVNNSHFFLPRLIRGNYILIFFLNGRREAYPLSIR